MNALGELDDCYVVRRRADIHRGAVGGIIGSYMYLDRESPEYPTGYGLSFALAALGITSALVMELIFKKKNRKRDQMTEAEIYETYTEEQLGKMGHKSPFFRYTL